MGKGRLQQMRRFKSFLIEAGGQSSGKLEMDKINIDDAIQFCKKNNFDVLKEIPNFKENFKLAKSIISIGSTKRKDMPVIDTEDISKFKVRLEVGRIDINKPLAKDPIVKNNPFPTGLSGTKAKKWLELGLKDGVKEDDIISVQIKKVKVSQLKPIQKQVYFDKSMIETIKAGIKKSLDFVSNRSFFIISEDNFIIDGHHRFLSALLLDPSTSVNCLSIDLSIKKLLPMATAYGDAIGNKRNL